MLWFQNRAPREMGWDEKNRLMGRDISQDFHPIMGWDTSQNFSSHGMG
jgi:hypothetical protein